MSEVNLLYEMKFILRRHKKKLGKLKGLITVNQRLKRMFSIIHLTSGTQMYLVAFLLSKTNTNVVCKANDSNGVTHVDTKQYKI